MNPRIDTLQPIFEDVQIPRSRADMESNSNLDLEGCNVAVVGGGPAGVLCAAQFAKQGATVTVYERRTLEQQRDPA